MEHCVEWLLKDRYVFNGGRFKIFELTLPTSTSKFRYSRDRFEIVDRWCRCWTMCLHKKKFMTNRWSWKATQCWHGWNGNELWKGTNCICAKLKNENRATSNHLALSCRRISTTHRPDRSNPERRDKDPLSKNIKRKSGSNVKIRRCWSDCFWMKLDPACTLNGNLWDLLQWTCVHGGPICCKY